MPGNIEAFVMSTENYLANAKEQKIMSQSEEKKYQVKRTYWMPF